MQNHSYVSLLYSSEIGNNILEALMEITIFCEDTKSRHNFISPFDDSFSLLWNPQI